MKEEGVYKVPLTLSVSLESRRIEFEEAILKAQRRLRTFAEKHGWLELTTESFADKARIFASKEAFDASLIELLQLPSDTKLLPTACACLEKRILMAVSPDEYVRIYPQGEEDGFYEKLLTHEMAHRLHIRILSGDEDAMGPVWFYEGFAVHASGQFECSSLELNPDEVWKIVECKDRDSYEKYSFVIKYFLNIIPLEELVGKAGDEDFTDWLRRSTRSR